MSSEQQTLIVLAAGVFLPPVSTAISRSSLSSASACAASWARRFWKSPKKSSVWLEEPNTRAKTCIEDNRRKSTNLLQRLYRCKIFGPPVQHPLVRLVVLLHAPLLFLLLLLFVALVLRLPKRENSNGSAICVEKSFCSITTEAPADHKYDRGLGPQEEIKILKEGDFYLRFHFGF